MNYQTSKQWTITLLLCVLTFDSVTAQFFKKFYDKVLKQGTVYLTANLSNSIEASESNYGSYGNLISELGVDFESGDTGIATSIVKNITPVYPFDYRLGFGIRKLARFDYERKPFNYYDGNEVQLAYAAPGSAVPGIWEYQFHIEKERWRGELFDNHRVFIKHTGNYHVFKVESREVGKINLKYQSAEIRGRFLIGKKVHVSAGAIVRTHDRAYGYEPAQAWLNNGRWRDLANQNGFISVDSLTLQITNPIPATLSVPIWINQQDGEIYAISDNLFINDILPDLLNQYNRDEWAKLSAFAEIAPVVGLDFYHYKRKFWLHAYGNLILPYHAYIRGDKDKSYLNRNNWIDGELREDSSPEQWLDFSAGWNMGWNIKRHFGIFIESEYSKMWDSRLFNTMVGINYQFN